MTATTARTARPAWDLWLDDLEDAAVRLDELVAAGEPLTFPELPPPPAGPGAAGLPPEHLPRAGRLLDRLERLERVVEARRDALGVQLQALHLPRPRPSGVPSHEIGAVFDVAG